MKLSPEVIQTLVTFLTGGGLVTLIAQGYKSIRTVRTGALSSTRAVVKDLVEARNEAEDRLDEAQREVNYWRDITGRYGFQLRQAGITPDPENPLPPRMTASIQRGARRDSEESGDIFP